MTYLGPGLRRSAGGSPHESSVEIAQAPGLTCIRDAKHRHGGTLEISRRRFLDFIRAIKQDRLRRP
ncbi:DUF397 domain-containing protein [Actinoalloteichus hymeniacidonis]|uniref:DUF397 family protein n=1 Tax=Actinoalloteichus hymeniacidonis TaxID=340345 RepID=A0AAC9HPM8_9PSEU|nr:DUF397 domain-containing protein [Actinoalloteichus hymeniacidonis]AOS63267.1 putative DUF397 family protein [Actinoalloteichus hymeniacidonis]MBB5908694.1 hypothetical protein [Actinoalloteichus hymeniacidonis]